MLVIKYRMNCGKNVFWNVKNCRINRAFVLTLVICRINRGGKRWIGRSLAGPMVKCRIIRVDNSTVFGLTVLHCIKVEICS